MKRSKTVLLSLLASLSLTFFAYAFDSGDNDWPSWRGKDTDGKASQKDVFKLSKDTA